MSPPFIAFQRLNIFLIKVRFHILPNLLQQRIIVRFGNFLSLTFFFFFVKRELSSLRIHILKKLIYFLLQQLQTCFCYFLVFKISIYRIDYVLLSELAIFLILLQIFIEHVLSDVLSLLYLLCFFNISRFIIHCCLSKNLFELYKNLKILFKLNILNRSIRNYNHLRLDLKVIMLIRIYKHFIITIVIIIPCKSFGFFMPIFEEIINFLSN